MTQEHFENPDSLFNRITEAREILGIGENATMEEIKNSFHKKILSWHPDKCHLPPDECREKSSSIIDAYKTIMDYCSHYRFSFKRDEVEAHAPYEELWFKLYGHDPMWGPPKD